MHNSIYFDVNKDPLELRGQRDHSGTNKIIWTGLCFNFLISYEAKTMHKISSKIVSEIVSENILIKFYLQWFVSIICHFYSFLSFICNHYKSIFYNWNMTLKDWCICYVNNETWVTFSVKWPWLVCVCVCVSLSLSLYIYIYIYIMSFFSVAATL